MWSPLEGQCIPVLSFPDASGRTPVKSSWSELSSPLDSGFFLFQSTTAKAAQCGFKPSLRTTTAPAEGAANKTCLSQIELCNDESVVAAGRRGGGRASAGAEWPLHGHRERRGGESPERPRCHPPNHSALPVTHRSFPGTLHRRLDALSSRRSSRTVEA